MDEARARETDPETIAKRLSAEQRRHLAGLHKNPAWRTTLAEARSGFIGLTPIGLAVRAILERDAGNG